MLVKFENNKIFKNIFFETANIFDFKTTFFLWLLNNLYSKPISYLHTKLLLNLGAF